MQAGCITISPQYLKKYTPMFEPGFLLLTNDHSFRHPPPPPPDNDRVCHTSVPTRENFPLHHCVLDCLNCYSLLHIKTR